MFISQITGKAVMLDEIINYVQSLQRQVEVLLYIGADVTGLFSECMPFLGKPSYALMQLGICSSCQ